MTVRPSATVAGGLGLTPKHLCAWPGADRRNPPRGDRHRLVLQALAAAIIASVDRLLAGRRDLDVLDVGCGCKPYLLFFASRARSYRGLDPVAGQWVDDVGSAEALPLPRCQLRPGALHAGPRARVRAGSRRQEDPPRPSSARRRVRLDSRRLPLPPRSSGFQPGLLALDPRRVGASVPDAGRLGRHRGRANGDVAAWLGYIMSQFVDEAGQRVGSERVRRTLVTAVNVLSAAVDRRYPPRARPRPAGRYQPTTCSPPSSRDEPDAAPRPALHARHGGAPCDRRPSARWLGHGARCRRSRRATRTVPQGLRQQRAVRASRVTSRPGRAVADAPRESAAGRNNQSRPRRKASKPGLRLPSASIRPPWTPPSAVGASYR